MKAKEKYMWPKKVEKEARERTGARVDVSVTSIIEEEAAAASTGGADVTALL